MAISWEAFRWALTEQESGGRYGAVGAWVSGDRAYGRYQVMGANVGNWTAKYYGKRLTPQQYLANHEAQDAVVNGVLGGYFKKYGPKGAAAMWYSGQSDPSKTYGNPPVYKYVDSVISRAGTYSGQSSGGSSASSTGGTVPVLDDDTLAAEYGLSKALINSSKELKSLFKKAVSGGWSASRFQASLRNSAWWKTQSSTLRKYITQKYEDPATWKQKNTAGYAKYNSLAVQVGLGSQMSKGAASRLLRDVTYKGLALGWSDARVKDYLGSRVGVHDGVMWGEAGEAFDKLHELAYTNGMSYKGWYESTAKSIVSGKTTLEAAEAHVRRQAAAKYSAFADQIMAGQNAIDLAAPYISTVSQLLELPETDIDLADKYVSDAMTGAKAGSTYPLWEFENKVRGDPRWKKTNNARESMVGTAHQVLQNFGLAF